MANKKKKSSGASVKPVANDENVVRIKAGATDSKKSDTKKSTKAEAASPAASVKAEKPAKVKKPRTGSGVPGVGAIKPVGRYFGGAWSELRLVRWPNRRATWSLTFAVLAYSAFFVVLVLLLDAAFKVLFDFILKK